MAKAKTPMAPTRAMKSNAKPAAPMPMKGSTMGTAPMMPMGTGGMAPKGKGKGGKKGC